MDLRAVRLDMSRADGGMVTMDVAVERLIKCWRDCEAAPEPGLLPPPLEAALAPEREPGTVPTPAPRRRKSAARPSREEKPAESLADALRTSLTVPEAPAAECGHTYPDVKFVANKRVCRRCD